MAELTRLTEEQKRKIETRLREVGALGPCPVCGNPNRYSEGVLIRKIAQDVNGGMDMATGMACASTVCNRCGFAADHALAALGLSPKTL